MLKHVMVPLDGSSLAEKALPYARQIIEDGGTITLLSVIDVPEYAVSAFYTAGVVSENPNHQLMMDQMVPQTYDYLNGIGATLKSAGYEVRCEAVIGDAAQSIVEMAEEKEIDTIVMCTHGRSGFSRWLFGSVTNKVLGGAKCPVFVVPNRNNEGQKNV